MTSRSVAAIAFLSLLCCLCSSNGALADEKRPIFMVGLGAHASCEQFVAATEGHTVGVYSKIQHDGATYWNDGALMMEYVFGLLTGLNATRDRSHQIMNDPSSVELWLRNWCAKNPKRLMMDAVATFFADTPGRKLE
jgi:hypothetical protein